MINKQPTTLREYFLVMIEPLICHIHCTIHEVCREMWTYLTTIFFFCQTRPESSSLVQHQFGAFWNGSSPLLALRKWLFWQEFTCLIDIKINISILQLIQNLKPSRVVILTSAPVCEYHTRDPGNITSDFVKVLKTKAWQEKFSQKECSYLETPNIIKGQAASGQIFFFNCGKVFAGAPGGGTKGILRCGCVAGTPEPSACT